MCDYKLKKDYLPMSESAYYMLLAFCEIKHGYGVIQYVSQITNGRIKLGPGTIYGTISRFEKDKLIISAGDQERRKLYKLTPLGCELLQMEIERLKELCENGEKYGGYENEKNKGI